MRSVRSFQFSVFSMVTLVSLVSMAPAQATLFNLDFTGVITNSRDASSIVFGTGTSGGQNGKIISGRIAIDDSGYVDQNPSIFNGLYAPNNGLFPQPNNFFTSTYTIDGLSFSPSRWMGPVNGHSLESASIQNIPPVNFVQQDILQYVDASQELLCSNPLLSSSCNGGALSTDQLQLKLFGIYDFIGSDALTQAFNFNAADISAIVGSPNGGQTNFYSSYHSIVTPSGFLVEHDFAGEFNLTSLSMQVASVPEPATLSLFAFSLVTLGFVRRRMGLIKSS